MQSPMQWPVRNLYKAYKEDNEKWFDTNTDVNLTLWHIKFTHLDPGLPSTATVIFNRLITGLLPIINRSPMMCDYD